MPATRHPPQNELQCRQSHDRARLPAKSNDARYFRHRGVTFFLFLLLFGVLRFFRHYEISLSNPDETSGGRIGVGDAPRYFTLPGKHQCALERLNVLAAVNGKTTIDIGRTSKGARGSPIIKTQLILGCPALSTKPHQSSLSSASRRRDCARINWRSRNN